MTDSSLDSIKLSLSTLPKDLEKFLNYGLTLDRAVYLVSNIDTNSDEDITKLSDIIKLLIEKGASFKQVSNFYVEVSYDLYEVLLKNGLKVEILLKAALSMNDSEKRDQLIDLALANKVDFDSIDLPPETLPKDLEKFLNHGLTLNRLVYLASNIDNYIFEDLINICFKEDYLSKLSNIIKFLIEKEASFKHINSFSGEVAYDLYEVLLKNGLKAEILLSEALSMKDSPERDQLVDLALANNVNFDSINLSLETLPKDLEKLINHGLTLNKAVYLVSNIETNTNEYLNIYSESIKFFTDRMFNLKDISYISYDLYENLVKNGFKSEVLFKTVLSMKDSQERDQLIDSILANGLDFNSINLLQETSLIDLEELSSYGLTLDTSVAVASNIKASRDEEVVKLGNILCFLIEKGASFKHVSYFSVEVSYDLYEKLLKNGLEAEILLSKALSMKDSPERDQLIDLAISNNLDFSSISLSINTVIKDFEKFLEHGLTLDVAAYLSSNIYTSSDEDITKLSDIIKFLIEKEASFKSISNFSGKVIDGLYEDLFKNGLEASVILASNKNIPASVFNFLIEESNLEQKYVLEYAMSANSKDLLEIVFDHYNNIVSLEINNVTCSIEILKLLNDKNIKIEIRVENYINFIKSNSFDLSVFIVKNVSKYFDERDIHESIRFNGASELDLKQFFDYYNLMKDFISTKEGKNKLLNDIELKILESGDNLENIEEYKNIEYLNKYGYNSLHLSILAHKYDLAEKLINSEMSVYEQTHNGLTPLQLFSNILINDSNNQEIIRIISETIGEIDIKLDDLGQSLADRLITSSQIEALVIEKSRDSLFYLFKKDSDLFSISHDKEFVNIAISHGNSIWSTGIWSAARLLSKNHPNVKFYLVKDDVLSKGGEGFINQFDAIINPGAGDTYPRKLEVFSKQDFPFNSNIEKHYQKMLEMSDKFQIPYFGICAGAQHFSLYNGGSLTKVTKEDSADSKQINFIKGTLAYFLSLTLDQQHKALSECEFPEVSFSGDRAHSFAAVAEKLGDNIELGAVSGDDVAMSYASNNGISYATQFHPEHYYKDKDDNSIHQRALLDNFIDLAEIYHDYRVNNGFNPIMYYTEIKYRLDECMTAPTCLSGKDVCDDFYYGDITI